MPSTVRVESQPEMMRLLLSSQKTSQLSRWPCRPNSRSAFITLARHSQPAVQTHQQDHGDMMEVWSFAEAQNKLAAVSFWRSRLLFFFFC